MVDGNEIVSIHIWKFVTGGIILLAFIIIIVFILPYTDSTLEKQRSLSIQKGNIDLIVNWKERLEEQVEKKGLLESYLSKANTGLVSVESFPDAIEEVFSRAEENNILLEKINPKEGSTNSKYEVKPMIFEFSGEYHDIAKFLNSLENGQYLMAVHQFQLEKENDQYLLVKAELSFFMKKESL